mgnify:CR=1 FL=1
MLKTLRKKGVAKKILWFIAVIIIISFGFFGTANYLSNTPTGGLTYAGKIFGHKISLEEFDRGYQHTRLQALLKYGENFDKISQFLNLDSETWDRLILLEETKKRGIKAADPEVIETIQAFPFFQRNGQYDPALYSSIIQYVFRSQPRDFEESMRDSIKLKKIFEQETAAVSIAEDAVREAYKNQNEKIQISYVLFTPENYKSQAAFDETKAQEYYTQHKNEFWVPLHIDIEYLQLEYDENATEELKSEIAAQAEAIGKELAQNPDLNAVALHYKLLINSTGMFSQDQPNLKIGWSYELLQKAFQLSVNQISEAIETPQGYYILKCKERKEGYIPEFEEAKEKVKDALLLVEAQRIAQEQAQQQLLAIKEKLNPPADDFTQIAKSLGLQVDQTAVFARGEYLPKIGIAKLFQDTAFSLTENNRLSDVIEVGKGYGILYLESYTPMDEAQFAKDKETLTDSLLAQKKAEHFNEFVTKLRLKAHLEDRIAEWKEKQKR